MHALMNILMAGAFATSLTACGSSTAVSSLRDANEMIRTPATLTGLGVVHAGGPGLSLKITAKILRGANLCQAEGRQVQLVQQQVDGVIEVRGITVETEANHRRVCTYIYRPVYETVETLVHGFVTGVHGVVVKNVDEIGHDVVAGGHA